MTEESFPQGSGHAQDLRPESSPGLNPDFGSPTDGESGEGESGHEPAAPDSWGGPGSLAGTFQEALRAGNTELCLQLIGEHPSLGNAPSARGGSLALEAYERELGEVAEALMGARGNGLDLDVHEAAAMGLPNGVRSALTENPLAFESAGPAGFFPLHRAAYRGHADAAVFLLEAGAEPNVRSENSARLTPLHSAVAGLARFGKTEPSLATIRLLLSAGADATATMEGGWTALSACERDGLGDAAQLLAGADAPQPQ